MKNNFISWQDIWKEYNHVILFWGVNDSNFWPKPYSNHRFAIWKNRFGFTKTFFGMKELFSVGANCVKLQTPGSQEEFTLNGRPDLQKETGGISRCSTLWFSSATTSRTTAATDRKRKWQIKNDKASFWTSHWNSWFRIFGARSRTWIFRSAWILGYMA